MDRRKNYYLTLDTETCGNFGEPLVYDIGYTIHDKKGVIYEKSQIHISLYRCCTHCLLCLYRVLWQHRAKGQACYGHCHWSP